MVPRFSISQPWPVRFLPKMTVSEQFLPSVNARPRGMYPDELVTGSSPAASSRRERGFVGDHRLGAAGWEPQPPTGTEPLECLLVSTVSGESPQDAWERVPW